MRGFTLIELITCIVILAMLAALSGPRFFSTQPFDQRGYADELAAALRYAEGVAVASGCNVSFTVNAAGYSADQRGAAGNTCAGAGAYNTPVVRTDGTPLSGTPPKDANVVAGGTIIFDASGQVTNPPPPALVVGPFTLTVDPVSGFITVQ
jgi:MSHA pilin protein MshC